MSKNNGKRLNTVVYVDATAYGPDDEVPAAIAKRITNPAVWSDSAEQDEDGGAGDYSKQKVADLQAEIDARNEGRDEADQIVPDGGKKDDLVAALEADDAAQGA